MKRNGAKKLKRNEVKGSEKMFYYLRETKRKGSETISVLLRFASKRKKMKSENGTPYWEASSESVGVSLPTRDKDSSTNPGQLCNM